MDEEHLARLNWFASNTPWWPQEGPQTDAMDSEADVLLYGGAAGGGKTALACGLAITQHRQTLFIRREGTQLGGVLDEVAEIIDPTRDGYSAQPFKEWKIPPWDGIHRKIIFGSTPNLGDETRYQGRARDLLVIDEAANCLESQVRFLMGWVRSTVPGQRCRTLLCSNPPVSAEGYWIIEMFAPWLDPTHPNPAEPGELRWFAQIAGEDVEVEDGTVFEFEGEEIIPQSRTFIPAKVTDNKYLRDTGYMAVLQALPEPLRSMMLKGDFMAAGEDDPWQVIPTAWIKRAQARWKRRPLVPKNITSVGVDPSRGGRDKTCIAPREDWHFHEIKTFPGFDMPNGQAVASEVIKVCGESMCPVHIDTIGIGAAVIDALDMVMPHRTVPCVASEKSEGTDWTGNLHFTNKRAAMWWYMRDILNPDNGLKVELPPDQELLSELCSPRYDMTSTGIKVESKKEIIKRLGRSTDKADSVIMCAERGRPIRIQGVSRPRHKVKGGISD